MTLSSALGNRALCTIWKRPLKTREKYTLNEQTNEKNLNCSENFAKIFQWPLLYQGNLFHANVEEMKVMNFNTIQHHIQLTDGNNIPMVPFPLNLVLRMCFRANLFDALIVWNVLHEIIIHKIQVTWYYTENRCAISRIVATDFWTLYRKWRWSTVKTVNHEVLFHLHISSIR